MLKEYASEYQPLLEGIGEDSQQQLLLKWPPVKTSRSMSKKQWKEVAAIASSIFAIACRNASVYISFPASRETALFFGSLIPGVSRSSSYLQLAAIMAAYVGYIGPIGVITASRLPSTYRGFSRFYNGGGSDFLDRCETGYELEYAKAYDAESSVANDERDGGPLENYFPNSAGVQTIKFNHQTVCIELELDDAVNRRDSLALKNFTINDFERLVNLINQVSSQDQNNIFFSKSLLKKLAEEDFSKTFFTYIEADDLQYFLQQNEGYEDLLDKVLKSNNYANRCLNTLKKYCYTEESQASLPIYIEARLDKPSFFNTAYGLTPHEGESYLLVKVTVTTQENIEAPKEVKYVLIPQERAKELVEKHSENYSLVPVREKEKKRMTQVLKDRDGKELACVGFKVELLNDVQMKVPGYAVSFIVDRRPQREKPKSLLVVGGENPDPIKKFIFSHLIIQTCNCRGEPEIQVLYGNGPSAFRNLLYPMKKIAKDIENNLPAVWQLFADISQAVKPDSGLGLIEKLESLTQRAVNQLPKAVNSDAIAWVDHVYCHENQLLFPVRLEQNNTQKIMDWTVIPLLSLCITVNYGVNMFDGIDGGFGPELEDQAQHSADNPIEKNLIIWMPVGLMTVGTLLVFIFFTISGMLSAMQHHLGYMTSAFSHSDNKASFMRRLFAGLVILFACVGLSLQGVFTLNDVLEKKTSIEHGSADWIDIMTTGFVLALIYTFYSRGISALRYFQILAGPPKVSSKNLRTPLQESLFKCFIPFAWADIGGTFATYVVGAIVVARLAKSLSYQIPLNIFLAISVVTGTVLHKIFSVDPSYETVKDILLHIKDHITWLVKDVLNYEQGTVDYLLEKLRFHDDAEADLGEESDDEDDLDSEQGSGLCSLSSWRSWCCCFNSQETVNKSGDTVLASSVNPINPGSDANLSGPQNFGKAITTETSFFKANIGESNETFFKANIGESNETLASLVATTNESPGSRKGTPYPIDDRFSPDPGY